MLIAFSGLPGCGKTTVARALAARLGAAYLRIDSIEQALLRSGELPNLPVIAGYLAGYAVAADCLNNGVTVVADSVNPVAATRETWRGLAREAGCPYLLVGVTCSDAGEHRRRVEARSADIEGHILPTWAEVTAREFEPWPPGTLVVDTADLVPATALEAILDALPHHRN